jgi:hypothetical protein
MYLDISRVKLLVGLGVANALHRLSLVSPERPDDFEFSYIDLGTVPLVHAQRLDFGDVRPQFAVA